MKTITKNIFLNTLFCPTRGWLASTKKLTTKLSVADKFRIEQGLEVQKRARSVFSEGVLIDEKDLESSLNKTKHILTSNRDCSIFEATFKADNLVTKVDIIKKHNDKLELIEIKSSINDRAEFIDDMAYTTMVTQNSGYNVTGCSLLLISRDFRLGMDHSEMFKGIEHTNVVLDRAVQFTEFTKYVDEIVHLEKIPEAKLRFECKNCGFFNDCMGKDNKNHIFDIPRLTQTKFDNLRSLEVTKIEDIPEEFQLTDNQKIIVNSVKNNTPFINQNLSIELNKIKYTAYYLDFETVQTAIPLYNNIPPYTQIPTQYSIHKCDKNGNIIDHFEFLSDYKRDSRVELTEKLIDDLEGEGSIMVYSSFEKTTINKLIKLFPEKETELNNIIDRLIDLEAIIRKNYYIPEFHGSSSIKVTLPAMIPDMTYDDLEISDGDSASAIFAYLALGRINEKEVEQVKSNLLKYCKQDTLAMVRIHQKLLNLIS
ncbi:DUF2779 domain-containing protein [candidate division KSB1 bacterium]